MNKIKQFTNKIFNTIIQTLLSLNVHATDIKTNYY